MTHDTHDTDRQDAPGLRLVPTPASTPDYGTPEPTSEPISGTIVPGTHDGLLAESEYGSDLAAGDVVGSDDELLRGPAVDGHLIELPHEGMVSLVGSGVP